jgi:hypothetical protein
MFMFRLLIAIAYPALLIPLYLEWSRRQAEAQIDKMQRAVFNTPGSEAPVPPVVLALGALLIGGYWLTTRLFGVQGWLRVLGVLLGAPAGVAIFVQRQAGRGQ